VDASPERPARLARRAGGQRGGLGDLIAGLYVISVLLLHELHEATEEPPPAILQRLALLAENQRGKPSAG
jgi:hypothetical protein